MTVSELLTVIERIAPLDTVWEKDNVGLLVGSPDSQVTRALVALDVSLEVIREAREWGAQMVLAHHPLIFGGLKTLTDTTASGRRVMALLESRISAICLHTNYDGASGGLNDELARLLGLVSVETLVNSNGSYGRYGFVEGRPSATEFAGHVKRTLKVSGLRCLDTGRPVSKVCVGSGGSGGLFERALAAGCDTLVTGDVKHDVLCDARDMGFNIIDATHFATEDIMCNLLISQLAELAPELEVKKARSSREPYVMI